MLRSRIIPVLLLRKKGLVKTKKYKNSKYVGDPLNAVKIFNDKEVDELVVLDIDVTKDKREPDYEFIKSIATECFMPLAYGGGISSLDQVKKIFSLGVEKVIFNTQALKNINLINEASQIFGSQSIVVSVDVKKNIFGKNLIYSHSNFKHKEKSLIDYVKKIEQNGAGEIIINSVDNDGIMNGYDLNLIATISEFLKIPLVALGGAGSIQHLNEAISNGASAAAAGSLFVFHGPHRAVLINYPEYNELKKIL